MGPDNKNSENYLPRTTTKNRDTGSKSKMKIKQNTKKQLKNKQTGKDKGGNKRKTENKQQEDRFCPY